MPILIIYSTFPNLINAEDCISTLLKFRLIACANISMGSSMYHWNNALTKEDEVFVIMKSIMKHKDNIETNIKLMHPYDIPAIVFISADTSKEYELWIKSEVISS